MRIKNMNVLCTQKARGLPFSPFSFLSVPVENLCGVSDDLFLLEEKKDQGW